MKMDILYENGKAYCKIEEFDNMAGAGRYDPATIYHVYEDGVVKYIYNKSEE